MNNQSFNKEEDDSNDEGNLRSRKDWHNIKKIIFNKKYLLIFIAVSVLMIDIVIIDYFSPYLFVDTKPEPISNSLNTEEESAPADEKVCNVFGVNLHGDLITYIPRTDYSESGDLNEDESSSDNIYYAIKSAEADEKVKAVIIEVDSTGGDPVAAEEVARVIKSSTKPVIAYIRSVGASAAYWAVSPADRIFALESSEVGSIGVTYSYVDNVKLNEKEGLNYNELATGKFKNTMSKNKALTNEEKNLIMSDLQKTHDLFVKTVSENRKMDINKVKELANGWAYNGNDSIKHGLIDEIGGLDEVSTYLKNNILNGEEVEICW